MKRPFHFMPRVFSVAIAAVMVMNPVSAFAVTASDPTTTNAYRARNGIYFTGGGSTAICSPTALLSVTDGNKDYAGGQIISDTQLATINDDQHKPVYLKAAEQVGIPWEIIAVIHLREHGLAIDNPSNGQGVYQVYSKAGGPYPTGAISQEEFLRQTIFIANFIKGKSENPDLLAKGDTEEIKMTLLAYNGKSAAYYRQAKDLGFSSWADGSPYVMNRADAKRDPTREPTKSNSTWGQIKTDGGGIKYPANDDYGAFVVFSAIANISSGSACSGAGSNGWDVSGANAMTLYYQYKDPWANQSYGGLGTIQECGCGPTSMAMIVATLNKDPTITPKVMADFFAANGGQIGGGSCGSTWSLFVTSSTLAKKYNLRFDNLGTDISKVTPAVKRGSFVLMSQDPGIFTSGGHFLLIRAVTNEETYLVADPYSEEKTLGTPGANRNAPKSWPGGYTAYEITGEGTPEYSTANVGLLHGNIKSFWEVRTWSAADEL